MLDSGPRSDLLDAVGRFAFRASLSREIIGATTQMRPADVLTGILLQGMQKGKRQLVAPQDLERQADELVSIRRLGAPPTAPCHSHFSERNSSRSFSHSSSLLTAFSLLPMSISSL